MDDYSVDRMDSSMVESMVVRWEKLMDDCSADKTALSTVETSVVRKEY